MDRAPDNFTTLLDAARTEALAVLRALLFPDPDADPAHLRERRLAALAILKFGCHAQGGRRGDRFGRASVRQINQPDSNSTHTHSPSAPISPPGCHAQGGRPGDRFGRAGAEQQSQRKVKNGPASPPSLADFRAAHRALERYIRSRAPPRLNPRSPESPTAQTPPW